MTSDFLFKHLFYLLSLLTTFFFSDGAPPATNVYSSNSAANSHLSAAGPPGAMPGAHGPLDGQRASASRGGARGSAQTMMNPMQQP